MALKVVGSGLGRTGTKSLQSALNMLGLGPCHHMVEVFAHPESARLWIDAAHGRPDWDAIFAGYQSMVDYPGALYWRQIAAHCPEAKVLHSVRDPDKWFESTQATIFAPDGPTTRPGPMAEFFATIKRPLRNHLHDRAYMTERLRRHTDDVDQGDPGKTGSWSMKRARAGSPSVQIPGRTCAGCALPVGKFARGIHRPDEGARGGGPLMSIRRRSFLAGASGLLAASAAKAQTQPAHAAQDALPAPTTSRGFNAPYTGDHLNQLAFPMGGIGAGMICLDGGGALSHVSIRNKPNVFNEPCIFAALSIKGGAALVLEGPVPGRKIFGPAESAVGLPGATYGLPRFADATFEARFPFGKVSLRDPRMPLESQDHRLSPFPAWPCR